MTEKNDPLLAIGEWTDVKSMADSGEFKTVICVIGHKGHMRISDAMIAAGKLCHVLRNRGDMKLHVIVDGFDDDPRDVWDIPEARLFIRTLVSAVETAGHPLDTWNLDDESRGTVSMCAGRARVVRDSYGDGFRIYFNERE